MKVLFINNFCGVDYLNDTVFHGGKSVLGEDLIGSTAAWYMYDDITEHQKHSLYGMGYTIAGKLPSNLKNDNQNTKEKIIDRYFDIIIFGSVHRYMEYYDIVKSQYKKNQIVFLDGEDEPTLREDILGHGVYFKREILNDNPSVLPISFGAPKSLIDFSVEKTKLLSTPTSYQTGYLFHNERDYYDEFKQSYFALTKKKAGWDCMRHYEIILNGTLPLFHNLHELPKNVMTRWDKDLLKECLDLFWLFRLDEQKYEELRNRMKNNFIENLTTESIFNYVINNL